MAYSTKQIRALELHAKQLDRRAANAKRQYDTLRAAFPEYGAPDALMPAARASDNARMDAGEYRAALTRLLDRESSS